MKGDDLVRALSSLIPAELARDLVELFQQVREDARFRRLGRTDAGKFVETLCQVLQFLESGRYDARPAVEQILTSSESSPSKLDDGLRICATRIARATYAVRSKRNIAHKGAVDLNSHDLSFTFASVQWILSELLRHAKGLTMEQAGALIAKVQAPLSVTVEDFGDRRLVLENLECEEELLVLLLSAYPDWVALDWLYRCMERQSRKTIQNRIPMLWRRKLIQRDKKRVILTAAGVRSAEAVLRSLES